MCQFHRSPVSIPARVIFIDSRLRYAPFAARRLDARRVISPRRDKSASSPLTSPSPSSPVSPTADIDASSSRDGLMRAANPRIASLRLVIMPRSGHFFFFLCRSRNASVEAGGRERIALPSVVRRTARSHHVREGTFGGSSPDDLKPDFINPSSRNTTRTLRVFNVYAILFRVSSAFRDKREYDRVRSNAPRRD